MKKPALLLIPLLLASCNPTTPTLTPGVGSTEHRTAKGHITTLTLTLDPTLQNDPTFTGATLTVQNNSTTQQLTGTVQEHTLTFDLHTFMPTDTLQVPVDSLNYGFVNLQHCTRTAKSTPGAQLNINGSTFITLNPTTHPTFASLKTQKRSEGTTQDKQNESTLVLLYSANTLRFVGTADCTGDLAGIPTNAKYTSDIELAVGWNLLRVDSSATYTHTGDHKPTHIDVQVNLTDTSDTSGILLQ